MSKIKQSVFDFSDISKRPTGFNDLGALKPASTDELRIFAKRNNLTYAPKADYDGNEPVMNEFSSDARPLGAVVLNRFDGSYAQTPFSVATIRFSPGEVYEYCTFAAITLPHTVPQVAICALLDHEASGYFGRPVRFDAGQRTTTGNELLDDYFAVYTPGVYKEAVTKTILTDEFVDTLLQYAPTFDIAITGNRLYILAAYPLCLQEDFKQIFLAAEAMIDALRTVSWSDVPPADGDRLKINRALSRFVLRAVLPTLAVSFGIGLVVAYSTLGSVSPISIVTVVAIIIGLLVAFFAMGPDRSQPKRPANTKKLVDRFGEINDIKSLA
ncbi:MAG TPA: hypothetical protein VLA77_04120 [Candidatus Saccharimonadales bacterium]|nr:hypothetical protein [Candidatus Saccharimonadales bacterium]